MTRRVYSSNPGACAQQARTLLADELAQALTGTDLLATPTTPAPASGGNYTKPPTDSKVAKSNLAYVAPFDLTGSPAVSIPAEFTRSGLPIGLQLVGYGYGEATILRAAHQYQRATEWHRRVPPLTVAGSG